MSLLLRATALLLSAAPLACWAAPAPTTLSLEAALAEAKGNSPDLQRTRAVQEEAGYRGWEAISGNLPKVSLTATHFFDLKYQQLHIQFGGNPASFPAIYPKTLLSLDVCWTVFDGFQSWNNYRAAGLGERAASLETRRAELVLENEVRIRFYQALAAQLLSDVAEQNVRTLREHLDRVRTLLAQGSGTRFDVLRVQTQLEEAVPEKLSADNDVALKRRALAEVMGRDADERAIAGALPVPEDRRVPENLSWESAQRADLEALSLRAQAAAQSHNASLSAWYPRVSLTAEKQFYNNIDYALTSHMGDAYSVGVMLAWNLFDGGAAIARQKETVARQTQAELAARSAQLKAPNEIDTWKRKFRYATALYQARQRAIESAGESVRLARLGVGAGTRTNTDLLDAELDLFRARAGLVRAQLESNEALLRLELALGRHL